MPDSKQEFTNFIINFVIVSITSAITKTICAPIERIKLILQNQHSAVQVLKGERQPYKGIIDCFLRIPKEQGFRSLWRGNGTNIMRYFPTQAFNFAFNDLFKDIVFRFVADETHWKLALIHFAAGGFAGTCSAAIMYPLEFCFTRVAVDIGSDLSGTKGAKREFKGLGDCVRKIHISDGMKGLYKGFSVGILGISLYRACYFGFFDCFKHLVAKKSHKHIGPDHEPPKPPFIVNLLVAQSATVSAGLIAYPLDTVSRRLQLESGRPENLKLFKSNWEAFSVLYHKEGFRTFYRGGLTNALRGFSGALVLVFYDEILHITQWKKMMSPCDNC